MIDSPEKLMADAEEFWNLQTPWVRRMTHIRGAPTWPSKRWQAIGECNFRKFHVLVNELGLDMSQFRTMVEWGSGGGANAIKFLRHFRKLYGVDISEHALHSCAQILDTTHGKGSSVAFAPVRIPCASPELSLKSIPEQVDFFLSTAVFQHFPSKDYGKRVVKIASQLVRPGGLAIIQFRWDDGGRFHACKKKDYGKGKNAVRFTSYGIGEFLTVMREAGFTYVSLKMARASYVYTCWVRDGCLQSNNVLQGKYINRRSNTDGVKHELR
jgi:cyclopropane fatty-acyl-phospholipid synthase-like methyltransferase